MDDIKKSVSVREAAERIGCSQSTIRRWLDEDRLPKRVTQPTRRVRIPIDAVERVARTYPEE